MSRKSKKKAGQAKSSAWSLNPAHSPRVESLLLPWWKREWFFYLVLTVITLLAYQPAWHAGFIWDDDKHLTQNVCIIGPLGLVDIWTSSHAVYYPLVLTTFWFEHALWGLRPLPYHLVNILMHAVGAILLWRVLRHLAVPGAGLGAMLWALHPVQVESAAWITEMKNTQSGVFYLLSILLFLRWLEAGMSPEGRRKIRRDYILSLVCAALAILSKSSTVMLPVVLGLCWWWREKGWRGSNLIWLMPLFLISLVTGGWTIWEQKFHSGALGEEWNQSWPERLAISGNVVWFYLGKLIWPHPLIFIYPRWQIDSSQASAYLPVLAVVTGLLILWWQRNGVLRPVFFAAAYFVISLFPVLGFFSVYFFRYSFVGDHFQYLASMGPLALAGAGIMTALDLLGKEKRWLQPLVCGALWATLAAPTWNQCRMYTDDETLFRTTIARNPNCWMAYNNLGTTLLQTGRTSEAIEQFEAAARIKPDDAEAFNNKGLVLVQLGRASEAIEQYQQALRIKPDYAEAHNNLGTAQRQAGQMSEAIEQYEEALRIKPDFAEACNNLGTVLRQTGQISEAIKQYEEALRINPDFAMAHYNLGTVLRQMGQTSEAIEQYEEALRINPGLTEVHNNLGTALARVGRMSEALEQFEEILKTNPDDAYAHYNLGIALQKTGRTSEAMEQYEQALRINPDFANARNNLTQLQALLRQKAAPEEK